jgi:hypothetical protein
MKDRKIRTIDALKSVRKPLPLQTGGRHKSKKDYSRKDNSWRKEV